jgi:hypothetical protein
MPQTVGNAVISCICVAHEKYESNLVDWQPGPGDRPAPVDKAGHGKIPGDVQGWAVGAWRLWNL